ncbi:hypothetical protein KGQ19_34350 [Catenulispora sp. NL8]|uniref:Uncharacterized protein n=1 Tax=Catenulispora pinistramenti TaxID=2705254 RepID=A0ABS5L0V7_9ACTN|nr:hypothetical protein [Catenulispora pinistramenti]MBS2551958.1 hypothetical protein [Catenulispora pinistramenti]
MTERIRQIFETTLHDEPPLVDIVAGAVEGAQLKRRKQRRDRIAVAVSPLALLALGVGTYTVLPGFGSSTVGDETATASAPSTSVLFPPVATDQPLNPTTAVHQAAVQLCSQDWSKVLAPISTNMMPETQQQAVDMCAMTGETLMTLMPQATVTLPDAPDLSMTDAPGEQWVVKTAAGRTQIGIRYLWPDSAYEKKHYGPFDQCQPNPVNNPPATTVPGPNGSPFPMRDPNAGHNQYCLQTRPAQQFYGALTIDETAGTVGYSVQNPDYGRYMIGTATVSVPVSAKPTSGSYGEDNGKFIIQDSSVPAAMSPEQFAKVFLDPRFNDYLSRYENYVLTHATADSFVVSGSKPVR